MSFDKDPFLQAVPQKKLAVLIDADNAQPEIIEGLLAEIALYGIASVKRIYGNWTTPNLQPWKEVLLNYSIQPIQQFDYTRGKNATDSALIIDAMDLLYTNKFDGFCIISSDSDFTGWHNGSVNPGSWYTGLAREKHQSPLSRHATSSSIPRSCERRGLPMNSLPKPRRKQNPVKVLTCSRVIPDYSACCDLRLTRVPIMTAGQTWQMWGETLSTSLRISIPVTTGIKNSRTSWKQQTFLR